MKSSASQPTGAVPNTSCSGGSHVSAAAKTSSNAMPASNHGFERQPMLRSETSSQRAANAVPTWHTTIARNAVVVARS
jgi:hypothetical protein